MESDLTLVVSPRFLQGNRIRSVTKKSFSGLDALQHL